VAPRRRSSRGHHLGGSRTVSMGAEAEVGVRFVWK
jgi:hypothetical protein